MVHKPTWFGSFSRDDTPDFPCPRCRRTTLKLDGKTFVTEETPTSIANHKHETWEPEWTEERFVCFLKCGSAKCGEIVAVSGTVSVEPNFDDEGDWKYEGMLKPKSMFPPPPILTLPDKTPGAVKAELELAFQLYWSDYGACANKIRTSVERLMDHFKVAKFRVVEDLKKPNKAGKMRPIDLGTRIDRFISTTGQMVHKDHLHALRVVGNLGTHNNTLGRTEVLEAFEIYEHALNELVGKKSAQINSLAKKLSKTSIKPKKDDFPF